MELEGGESALAWAYFYSANVVADHSKLIIGERDGKPIYGWNADGSHLLPKDWRNGSNS